MAASPGARVAGSGPATGATPPPVARSTRRRAGPGVWSVSARDPDRSGVDRSPMSPVRGRVGGELSCSCYRRGRPVLETTCVTGTTPQIHAVSACVDSPTERTIPARTRARGRPARRDTGQNGAGRWTEIRRLDMRPTLSRGEGVGSVPHRATAPPANSGEGVRVPRAAYVSARQPGADPGTRACPARGVLGARRGHGDRSGVRGGHLLRARASGEAVVRRSDTPRVECNWTFTTDC